VGIVALSLRERIVVEDALRARAGVVESLALASTTTLLGEEMGVAESTGILEDLVAETRRRTGLEVRRVSILDLHGEILVHSEPNGVELPTLSHRIPFSDGVSHWYEGGGQGSFSSLWVGAPLRAGSRRWGGVLVQFGMSGVNARLTETLIQILAIVGALTLINFLSTGWVVRRWMNPITELTRSMEAVRAGNMDVSVSVDRADEIGQLARQFGSMLQGLQKARDQREEIVRKQANLEKLAALGRLSAGVAHEINNPLGGILTCLEALRHAEPGSPRHQEYAELIRSGLERIGTTVQQLLRFARSPEVRQRRNVDLHRVIDDALAFSRFQNRQNRVRVVRSLGEIPPVLGDPDLLHQVFLNLVLNAMQAMPEGGTLEIGTWDSDGRVAIVFEDDGPGIPEGHHRRIFDPFFTTKEVGVGTGLGLSVALGIVQAHDGTIEVSDRTGGGARFTIHLPAAAPEAARAGDGGT
jgi:two-component system NtrC family sensor kinase